MTRGAVRHSNWTSLLLGMAVVVAVALFGAVSMVSAQAPDTGAGGSVEIPVGLVSDPGVASGHVGNTGAEHKFDKGFYQKIQDLILEEPSEGDFGVYDGERYYNVIIVVSRDNGDGRDHDVTAAENKVDIVARLEKLGARNIVAAEMLSFVTASIPVAYVPGFSLHDEVYVMGDGEIPITGALDRARRTINATPSDLRAAVGSAPNGSDITVAVVDSGISHNTAFGNRIAGRVLCDTNGCTTAAASDVVAVIDGVMSSDFASHGTKVAQVVAASGMTQNNGISSGVTLLDAAIARQNNVSNPAQFVGGTATSVAHAVDWSLKSGADIINMSIGAGICNMSIVNGSYNLVVNEAVDKGLVAVVAAGNAGLNDSGNPVYRSVKNPGCAHNAIAVGGIADGYTPFVMYERSGRGPIGANNMTLGLT